MAEITKFEDIKKIKTEKESNKAFKETIFNENGAIIDEDVCPIEIASQIIESDFGKNKRSQEILNLVMNGKEFTHKWPDGKITKYSLVSKLELMDPGEILEEMFDKDIIEKIKQDYMNRQKN